MSVGLALGLVWLTAALAVLGARRRAGWALAAAGIPVLGLVTYHHGPFWGIGAMVVGMLLLRKPRRAKDATS